MVTLTATYPKPPERGGSRAMFVWSDGLEALTPHDGRPDRLPHDLGHYILESQVDLPFGFWSLIGQQTPFESFMLTKGRWPRKQELWFERAKRKHPGGLIFPEAISLTPIARGELDVHRDWPAIRRMFTRAYAYEGRSPFDRFGPADIAALVPFWHRMHALWASVPVGGALRICWPPSGADPDVLLALP